MSDWLLLAVSGVRQHGGNDGYADDPESIYRWDSTVPHHAEVKVGDSVAIWDRSVLLGAAVVESIGVMDDVVKTVFKCPHCRKAGIKRRQNKSPRFKCYKCKGEFDSPEEQQKVVRVYEANYAGTWVELNGALDGSILRALCRDAKSQQSMRPLRRVDFHAALREVGLGRAVDILAAAEHLAARDGISGGHKRRVVRVRIGQGKFRQSLLEKYGSACAITGSAPPYVLEASHLYSYAQAGEHRDDGGLLLRRDVHRLFDLGYVAVHPTELKVDVSGELLEFPAYRGLQGVSLQVSVTERQRQWFADHWAAHRPARLT